MSREASSVECGEKRQTTRQRGWAALESSRVANMFGFELIHRARHCNCLDMPRLLLRMYSLAFTLPSPLRKFYIKFFSLDIQSPYATELVVDFRLNANQLKSNQPCRGEETTTTNVDEV
jgi:hypothetical protein